MEVLDYTTRETGLSEDVCDVLGGGWCLWRWLEDYGVSCEESWDEGVDESEVWVLSQSLAENSKAM